MHGSQSDIHTDPKSRDKRLRQQRDNTGPATVLVVILANLLAALFAQFCFFFGLFGTLLQLASSVLFPRLVRQGEA